MSKTKTLPANEMFYVSVAAAIYNPVTKQFLVLKDADESGEYYKKFGPWELPGGRIHTNEKVIDALKREIQEEAGLTEFELVGVVDANLSQLPYNDGVQGFLVTYLAYVKEGEVTVSAEHSEYRWMTLEEIEADSEFKEWFKERIRKVANRIREASYLTDVQRLTADFENYKKRMAAGQAELSAHLTRGIVTDLIPILDNFHAAITHVPKESEGSPWVTGITYIEKQFEDVLAGYGVKPIEVKVGDAFDPTKHEALSHEEKAADEKKDETKGHTISKVVQKGYQIGDTIVRAAKVIVQ